MWAKLALLFLQAAGDCEAGDRLYAARAFAEAQERLWSCVLAGTDNPDHAWRLAQTYRELKNYSHGLERLRTPLQLRPASVDLLYLAGFLHFRDGRHRESISLLGQAFRLNSYDWRIHTVFALNYIALDIRQGARYELEVAIKLRPGDPELYYLLARLEYTENRFAESITASQRALELNPVYAAVYTNLGLCYEATGEAAKAEQAYQRAIELAREQSLRDEWPWLNYASMLLKGETPEKSLPLLEEARKIAPQSAKVYHALGRAYRRLGRDADAKAALERACALDPRDPDAVYALATLLLRSGDKVRGEELMARFMKLRGEQKKR